MSEITDTHSAWLDDNELDTIRGKMPVVYVEAVPVRVDDLGIVQKVGLLLRMDPDGTINRGIVSGRVFFGERVRDALLRHLEKDLGPLALPRLPSGIAPFTVAEYFPNPEITGFHDPRQHAVSLVYIVPVEGDCQPSVDALTLTWHTPEEVTSPEVTGEMTTGHDRIVRRALAYVGQLTP